MKTEEKKRKTVVDENDDENGRSTSTFHFQNSVEKNKKCRKKAEKEKKVEKAKKERRGEEKQRRFLRISNHLFRFSKKVQEKEENAVKTGIHNSNLWEARLNLMDLSRKHYR